MHPPVAGTDDEHLDEIASWLQVLDPQDEVWVSHVSHGRVRGIRATGGPTGGSASGWAPRCGTATSAASTSEPTCWTRDRARAGTTAGYQQRAVPFDATLVMVGAGTAHGVHPLDGGVSPFHFQRRRLALLEPPHMHTSMVLVPAGEMAPDVGDVVDVQRPLITTIVDEVVWR